MLKGSQTNVSKTSQSWDFVTQEGSEKEQRRDQNEKLSLCEKIQWLEEMTEVADNLKSSRARQDVISPKSAWQKAIDYGVDVSLIEINLSKSAEDLINMNTSATRAILELRASLSGN